MLECEILSLANAVGYCNRSTEGRCVDCKHALVYIGVRKPPSPGSIQMTDPELCGRDLVVIDTYREGEKFVRYTQRIREGVYEVVNSKS